MDLRAFLLGIGVFCIGVSRAFAQGDLWLVEQDFVKFGKRDAYEEYIRGLFRGFWSDGKNGSCCTYAQVEGEAYQYIYLMPVGNGGGLQELMDKKRAYVQSLGRDGVLPFLSTLNFAIASLHRFLPDCSYLPRGTESLLSHGAVHFFIFGVMPPSGGEFEGYVSKMASGFAAKNSSICLRTWKVVVGGDVPKYVVGVFANTEKNAKKMASGLDFTEMKNILRSQKEGTALLKQELSFVKKG